MRDAFCRALVNNAGRDNFVFLTGDLGFKALEPLRAEMGPRFINAGVAEQNMVLVAAGMARTGLRPWTYSIAPFMYARPFEQIRNDVCLTGLPVVLVGNGGGYGYGVMGGTHHALEDYGALLTLPSMRAFVPAFDQDLQPMVDHLMTAQHPAYVRLGLSELPKDHPVPEWAAWRCLMDGNGPVVLAVGPLVGPLIAAASELPYKHRPSVWLVSELPITYLPPDFVTDLSRSGHLIVLEEHTAHGGLGQMISHALLTASVPISKFTHHRAQGYVSGLYGSQKFHRNESGLSPDSVLESCAWEHSVQSLLVALSKPNVS